MLDQLIIFCAKYLVVAPVGALLAYGRKEGSAVAKKLALEVVLALPLAYVLARMAGMFYSHEQPFAQLGFEPLLPHAIDNSFPSDHVAFASVLATAAYLRHRTLGLSLWAFVAIIGIARVAAGLHWPLDLVGGALVAVIAVFGARYLLAYTKLG